MLAAPAPLLEAEGVQPPAGGSAFWIETRDDVRLRAALWSLGPRGTAVVFPGRTEFIEKYYEPVSRLQGLGFAAAVIDWRGQGLSDRTLPDQRKGHVQRFSYYQRDFDALLAALVAAKAPRPWLLVGHSMGGAIAARTLMRQRPANLLRDTPPALARGIFVAAVLSSPMLGLHGVAGGPSAAVAATALSALGFNESYVPGGGAETLTAMDFDDNALTSDRGRFDKFMTLVSTHPDLALGGATWGWVRAARREMRRLRPTATPMLIAHGDHEEVVSIPAIRRFYQRAPNAEFLTLEGARHEPMMETDAIQQTLWSRIEAFVAANGF